MTGSRFGLAVLFSAVFAIAGCSESEMPEAAGGADAESPLLSKCLNSSEYSDDSSLLLYLDRATADAFLEDMLGMSFVPALGQAVENTGAVSFRRVFPYVPEKEALKRQYGLDRWYKVIFPEGTDIDAAAAEFAEVTEVERIQFNARLSRTWSGTPVPYSHKTSARLASAEESLPFNDEALPDQWHYINTGNKSVSQYAAAGADINVKDAWKLAAGNPDIIVAVVDEGVKYDHPDLAENMWTNSGEIAGNNIDDDGNGYIDDIHGCSFVSNGPLSWTSEGDTGHGTHVAGTIAAVNGNSIGCCGIAGGSGKGDGVRIMSCQIYEGNEGGTEEALANAVLYALEEGASVLQCSFGYPAGIITADGVYEMAATIECQAMKCFIEQAKCPVFSDNGGIAIFAAGNEAAPMSAYPGAYRDFISVTAIGPDNLPTYYTNYGPGCNIAAPGGELPLGNGAGVLSTFPRELDETGAEYAFFQGTSMACPHVSGVAALGLSYALDLGKTFTRDEFVSMLLTSVNDIDSYLTGMKTYSQEPVNLSSCKYRMGTGTVDAWRLLMQIEGTPCAVVKLGERKAVSLDPYFGGGYAGLTYTGFEITEEDKTSLGMIEEPELKNGCLYLVCTRPGSIKLTVNAIAGGSVAGSGSVMGGIPVSKEISVIARGVRSDNGGWL